MTYKEVKKELVFDNLGIVIFRSIGLLFFTYLLYRLAIYGWDDIFFNNNVATWLKVMFSISLLGMVLIIKEGISIIINMVYREVNE